MLASEDDPFTAYLNPPQAEAVKHVDGPLLVFAGAGSGKTRVITFRVANLIAREHVPPYRILAVTFTNKAAGEMRSRLEQILGGEVARDVWVGTFHATCARLLRRYHDAVGLSRDFVIYDDADQKAVVARVLKELAFDDRSYPPRQVLSRIHAEKQDGRTPEEVMADVARGAFADEVVAQCFEAYEKHLKAANAVDFDDLLLHVMRLAEDPNGTAGKELRSRFSHVLVDEFQDTNQVQYRLVRALASSTGNLCVVGDDDQAIYRWRGGDVRIIRGYKRDFPSARVVKLEENYRSTARVVRAALAVIAPSREREPKELFTRNADGDKVHVVRVRDEREEAAFVISHLRETLQSGVSPGDVAVFYRIHAMSRVLEEAMRAANLPYRIVGGTRFFERAEIKDFLAYLRVVMNPRSDVDVLRIVNVPPRGIGDTTLSRIAELAKERGTSVYDAIDAADAAGAIAPAARKKLAAFHDMIEGFRRGKDALLPSELAKRILEETGYKKKLESEDSAEADSRINNLDELVGSISEFEDEAKAAGGEATLGAYLERISLSTSADEQKDGPRVSLMTVHGAKGLEFHTVFITGMEEQLFPYERRNDGESDEEEERRLAYVAITRARKRLFLTHAVMRTLFGNTRYGAPSRFLHDLPEGDLARSATQAARTAPSPESSRYGSGGGGYGSGGYGSGGYGGRGSYGGSGRTRSAPPPSSARPAWSPSGSFARPTAPPASTPAPAARAPGERYVERDDDVHIPSDDDQRSLGRGARVRHPRFGDGVVLRVEGGADPSATVDFPGWGEKRILLRFLST